MSHRAGTAPFRQGPPSLARGGVDTVPERLYLLFERLEALQDPVARQTAGELASTLLEMYGEGLARIVDRVQQDAPPGSPIQRLLVEDEVVGGLLLIHDLYPVDLETRVRRAVDKVQPYAQSHGCRLELADLTDRVARIRMVGVCDDCPTGMDTLEHLMREALAASAPDLERHELVGSALEVRREERAP